jgi:two-component system alkaline phosphatase synthesis response regulator PhoP
MSKPRILVVDDDPAVVRLMRSYLEQAGYEVLVAEEGNTAWMLIRKERPDLVLLDLMLPGRDGWEITRLMRADAGVAHIPVIMLTAMVEDMDKIMGLELGADDYITKPYNPREVVARVRARLRPRQEPKLAGKSKVVRAGRLIMDVSLHQVLLDGREVNLTATEFELLRALMEQAGYVLTRRELIRRALGADYLGLERTLDSHIRNLRRKLSAVAPEAEMITNVYGVGYRLEGTGGE